MEEDGRRLALVLPEHPRGWVPQRHQRITEDEPPLASSGSQVTTFL